MAKLNEIIQWCNQTLKSHEFKDYAPNGLQIEGKQEVNKVLCAVTASQDAIDAAIEAIKKAEDKKYELILMDIHMPILDGYEATKEIRKRVDI